MGLDMGHLNGRAHKTEGKSPSRMDEFFRNIRTEKTNWRPVLGEKGNYFPVSCGSDRCEFF